MSYNGSGTFNITSSGQPVVTNTVISSTAFNALTSDLATGLSTAITKDGQTTPTNNIPLGGYKITNLGDGTAATDAVNLLQSQQQTQNSYGTFLTATGADTITATCTPSLTAYVTGQMFNFAAAGTNTGPVTINISGLGAKSIYKNSTTELLAGDLITGYVYVIVYNGTQFQVLNVANNYFRFIVEPITISATASTGTIAYDMLTQSVVYYTTAATTNWTLNFRASSTVALNTLMSTGQIISVTFMATTPVATAFTAATSATTMTVSAVSTGTLYVGQIITGSGIATGTYITSFGSGSGGTGTYNLSTSQTVTSQSMTGSVPFNSAVTIDGNSVTPKWQNGSAPSTGYPSSVDTYTYAIIKTGNAAFTVLASQTQFKA
jgi:hypothetical protein